MKKIISVILCMLMFASVFAGCGKDEPVDSSSDLDGKTPVTIKFITHRTDRDRDGTFAKYIEKFNEKYPNITVDVESIEDYAGDMATRIQTENYGDVFMIVDAISAIDLEAYCEPFGTVDELADEYGYRPEFLYAKYYDGTVYGLSSMISAQGIVYNKKVWEEAGVTELPTTPEEFYDALQLIKDNTDAIPLYTNANSGWTLTQWESHCNGAANGDPDYANNKVWQDKDLFKKGGTHYEVSKILYDVVSKKLCEDDPTTCDWEASKLQLAKGELGCMVLGNWAITQIQEQDGGKYADDIGYMPFPREINGKQYSSAASDYCFGINVNSDHKEAAKAFILFMVNESGMATSEGCISLLADDPMPATLEAFENCEYVVDNPATPDNEGKLDLVQEGSGITLWDGGERLSVVVDIARGADKRTFDGYMEELTADWAEGIESAK